MTTKKTVVSGKKNHKKRKNNQVELRILAWAWVSSSFELLVSPNHKLKKRTERRYKDSNNTMWSKPVRIKGVFAV